MPSTFRKLVDSENLVSALAGLQSSSESIDLIRRHGLLFYVFANDWIHGIVPAADKGLGMPAIHRQIASPLAPPPLSTGERLLLAVANYGRDPVFLDVGTNYGQWLLRAKRALKAAGLSMETYTFEPGVAGRLAAMNIELHQLHDVNLVMAAVGDVDGVVPLFSNAGHTEDNKILNRRESDRMIPTPIVRLDTVIGELGEDRDYFIKIDTQGAEYSVLKGLGRFASSGRVAILTEFSPKAMSTQVKPIVFLKEISEDFVIIGLDNQQNDAGPVVPDQFEGFIETIWNKKAPFCDLALVPKTSRLHKQLLESATLSPQGQ